MTGTAYHDFHAWGAAAIETDIAISVVIPAYNEEWRILPTIGAIATYMSSLKLPWELVIADDGSKDTTAALVGDLNLPNLRLLIAERNGGKGSAVRRGVAAARGATILIADADQSTPIEQFGAFLAKVTSGGHDIAIGSRGAIGSSVSNKSWYRKLMSWGLQRIVRTFFGIKVRDTQCGFKVFTADCAHDLFERQIIDGFSFDLEVLYLANKLGYRTAEIPVEWIDAPGSTVDAAKVAAKFLSDLVHIRLNDFHKRYAHRRSPLAPGSPVAVSSPVAASTVAPSSQSDPQEQTA
jgi:dolichyl-phosphate beta-glucosyltransferase